MQNKYKLKQFLQRHRLLAFILLLAVVSFLPTFTNGFQTGWDDQWMLMNAFTVGDIFSDRLLTSFTKGISGQYDPLNQLMYSLLYRIDGYNAPVYHAACLLLHLGNIVCVYVLMGVFLSDCSSLSTDRCRLITLFVTLFFAIHPLQVESVAWISASKIPLSTLFYLLGSLAFVRCLKAGGCVPYLLTMLSFLAAYFSKEAAVGFPLWATLMCLWYGVTPRMPRFRKLLLPLYAVGLLMGLHTVFVVTSYNHYLQGETFLWWQRLVFCFYSMVTYVFKWFFPLNLSWMYRFPIHLGDTLPMWLLPYPLLFCLLVYALWDWLRRPFVASALLFTLIHLLFVLHITVLPRGAIVADRYMYLPLLGFNALLAYGLTAPTLLSRYRRMVFVAIGVLALLCVALSYDRTQDWKDSRTLRNAKMPSEITVAETQ